MPLSATEPGAELELVLTVERAYVAAATGGTPLAGGSVPAVADDVTNLARGAVGAVASRYLAVGTPRTLGLIADGGSQAVAAMSLLAHRAWFRPREVRCAGSEVMTVLTAALLRNLEGVAADGDLGIDVRTTSVDEALACDIVCVHVPIEVRAAQLRRGTHVNMLHSGATIDADLATLATVTREVPGLGALAAGLVDGRQLDELTVFLIGDAAIAIAAIATGIARERGA